MRAKRTVATDISAKVRKVVNDRDRGCIFCKYLGFIPTNMPTEIMHYIPRSAGGLGIPENLAVGCIYHHRQMDTDGKYTERQCMRALFRHYLREVYKDSWNEDKLVWRHDMNYGGGDHV